MDERLAVTFPADHPLAGKETITFESDRLEAFLQVY